MGGVITVAHTMVVSHLISQRHTLSETTGSIGYKHPMEDMMFKTLSSGSNAANHRIFVHWGVYGSGKSWAARNTALRLQDEDGKLVIFLRGYKFTFCKSMHEWLRMGIGIPEGQDEAFAQLRSKQPIVIILDHSDMLLERYSAGEVVGALRELIGTETEDVRVMLIVTSWERALELCSDWGCKMIGDAGCGRWTYEQLLGAWETFPPAMRPKQIDAVCNSFLQICAKSGAVGELMYVDNTVDIYSSVNDNLLKGRANVFDNEWRNGILALEGGIPNDIGRFPDKHGHFDHSLVFESK